MEKINAGLIFALSFAQILTSLLLVFSKKAILFLIYFLDDKANGLLLNKLAIETKICHFLQNAAPDFDETF